MDAEKLEIQQLMDYMAFKDLRPNAKLPESHPKIPVHFIYDVKHNGRHKRLDWYLVDTEHQFLLILYTLEWCH